MFQLPIVSVLLALGGFAWLRWTLYNRQVSAAVVWAEAVAERPRPGRRGE